MKAKILVVHNDRKAREAVTKILRENQLTVYSANNHAAGFQAALAGRPDLVVSGHSMPGMDGLTMAMQLRSRGIKIPIIFYVQRLSQLELSVAQASGVTQIIHKNEVGLDGLLVAVKKCLASAEKKKGRKK